MVAQNKGESTGTTIRRSGQVIETGFSSILYISIGVTCLNRQF